MFFVANISFFRQKTIEIMQFLEYNINEYLYLYGGNGDAEQKQPQHQKIPFHV